MASGQVLAPNPGFVEFSIGPSINNPSKAEIESPVFMNPSEDTFCFCVRANQTTPSVPAISGLAISFYGFPDIDSVFINNSAFEIIAGQFPGGPLTDNYQLFIASPVATTIVDTGSPLDGNFHEFKVCSQPGGPVTLIADGRLVPVVINPGSIPNLEMVASMGVFSDGNGFPPVHTIVDSFCTEAIEVP